MVDVADRADVDMWLLALEFPPGRPDCERSSPENRVSGERRERGGVAKWVLRGIIGGEGRGLWE